MMTVAETGGDMDVTRVLNSAEFVGVSEEKCISSSWEFYVVLARFTGSEAGAVVWSVSDMDGVKRGRSSTGTVASGRWAGCFECNASACIPEAVKDVSQVKLPIMQWEEKRKKMMAELGGGGRIPYLRRMLALMEICPKEVKEQMLMRLGEIGEDYVHLKMKVVSYCVIKAAQTQGGQNGGPVLMDVDWVDVDQDGSMSAAIRFAADARRPPRCSASGSHESGTLFRHPCVGFRCSLSSLMSLRCSGHALSSTHRTHVTGGRRPSATLLLNASRSASFSKRR